jgi:hypothetical protein
MSTSPFRFSSLVAATLLIACGVEERDERSMCMAPAQLAAYDTAYELVEPGGDTTALRLVASQDEASCALAGTREGLSERRHRGHRDGHDDHGHHGHHHGHGHQCGGGEDSQCRDDGRFAGQAAATAYCELSIALDGLDAEEPALPGAESRCSRKFEDACMRAFDEAARHYAQLSGDPGADCRPFMTGEFRAAYEAARYNQCLFSLAAADDEP